MPRVKLSKPRHPPIDWLMAAILERKKVMGLTMADLAEAAHMSPESFRHLMADSTRTVMDWRPDIRNGVCRRLGINISTTISTINEDGDITI